MLLMVSIEIRAIGSPSKVGGFEHRSRAFITYALIATERNYGFMDTKT